jgi:hypothetical protein
MLMSGPILRSYGFPNFEKIFGERPIEHGVEEPESADARPDEKGPGESKAQPASSTEKGPGPGETKAS